MTPFVGIVEPSGAGYFPSAAENSDSDVVELQLLLSRGQAAALEAAARVRGMTSGQILRRVIDDLFTERSTPRR